MTSGISLIADGDVTIDGTGAKSCIEMGGINNVWVDGFTFTNNGGVGPSGGWSVVGGIALRDLNNVSGTPCHDITITNCTFRDLRKHAGSGSAAISIQFGSFGSSDGVAAYNIDIRDCSFYPNEADATSVGFGVSHVVPYGNIKNFRVTGCYFYHDPNTYGEGAGGIEFVANHNTAETSPNIPRQGVISNNTFYQTEPWSAGLGARYCIYVQGRDILVERNEAVGWGIGIGVLAEQGNTSNPSERVWVRYNRIETPVQYGLVTGAWADNYQSCNDVWMTNNTITRADTSTIPFPTITIPDRNTTDSLGGLTGDSRFANNLVYSGAQYLDDERTTYTNFYKNNVWASPHATPVRLDTYSNLITASAFSANETGGVYLTELDENRFPNWYAALETPTWYTSTLFGKYHPDKVLDLAGNNTADYTLHSKGATEIGPKTQSTTKVRYRRRYQH